MSNDEGWDDMAVVRAVLAGNHEEFRTLVSRYHAAVAALGRRILHSQSDLADFVQDVFLKAFVHLGQYSGTGRFYSWLIRIAYTTAINRLHRAIPEVPTDPKTLEQLWSDGRSDNPQRVALRALLADTVAQAIRELPGHYALAVELFFFLDLRYREIAEMTGLPVNTVKSHVRRARLLLQQKLAGTIAEDYYDL
ncbi:MAG: sigma-70 family RNA polymerase sigma factor [Spirochaeta sp.]|jgi:RNA polymerase sigma-70 factor (ECF subfamily)|nr:sigma-70 family RNA polymerase sigma factor [Spirochaeta sp.]